MTGVPGHPPATPKEMEARGWESLDVILVTGDPLIDHPSFPANLLSRVLEARGFRVGLISRPKDPAEVALLGRPRLFFGVTSGALDSMVANYTAARKARSDDPYSPGGEAGGRPDRALTVYCSLVRRAFGKTVLVVAGGLEASLRRFAHYDWWSDKVRRPVLLDCGADVLIHGQGERPIQDLAAALDPLLQPQPLSEHLRGRALARISDIPGLMYKALPDQLPSGVTSLPSAEEVAADPAAQVRAFQLQEKTTGLLAQQAGSLAVVGNPAAAPLSSGEMDWIFGLPFTRDPHPSLSRGAEIPALVQVRFSITSHRGCFGGCSFCSIGSHQGKEISSRTEDSVLEELAKITRHPDFRGTVPDLGGPSANMYGSYCSRPTPCDRRSCLWPKRCPNLQSGQGRYLNLLRRASRAEGVNHVFVTTGLRLDLALENRELIRALALEHTSGHLKVAPEHTVPRVLERMGKPAEGFQEFLELHRTFSREAGRTQSVIPYLIAAHPGCTMNDMVELAIFLKKNRLKVETCQLFTPTPGTASTVMYATGIDPRTGKRVFVEKDAQRRELQKALALFHLPENRQLVRQALALCGRQDVEPFLLGSSARPSSSRDMASRAEPGSGNREQPRTGTGRARAGRTRKHSGPGRGRKPG